MFRILGIPGSVILVFVGMTVIAVAVMVAFAFFASRSDDTSVTGEEDDPREETIDTHTTPASEIDVELADITHVGPSRADDLRAEGYESVADVAEADRGALTDVEGIGSTRVERIAESASGVLDADQQDAHAVADGGESGSTATDSDGETPVEDTESERPRATVTFDAPADESDADSEKADEAPHSGRVSVWGLLTNVFASDDSDSFSASKGDEPHSEGTENADGDSSALVSAVTEVDPEPSDTSEESAESEAPLVRAKTVVTDALAEVNGRGRMLIDRRAIDLRAYGIAENWETIKISVSDTDSAVNRHLLTEIIDLDELEAEVEHAATDGGQPTSGDPSRVRISHEGIAQLEAAAARGRPEAKRTVTLFRRVLRGCSSGTVVRRFTDDPQEGGNVTVE